MPRRYYFLMTFKILFMKESTEGFTEKNNLVMKKSKKEVDENEKI